MPLHKSQMRDEDSLAINEGTQGRRGNIQLTPATRSAIHLLIAGIESLQEREEAEQERRQG